MTVRSSILGRSAGLGTTPTVLYTVPTGWRAILKEIEFHSASGTSDTTGNFWIQPAAGGYSIQIASTPLTTPWIGRWTGWAVLYPGDQIFGASSVGSIYAWASGTLLKLTGLEP